ncbi:MAG: TonB-dependent receptor, partial [Pseudomonadota bacterium]
MRQLLKDTTVRCVALTAMALLAAAPLVLADTELLNEVTVTSKRRAQPLIETTGNVAVLDGSIIRSAAHQHVHELLSRTPATWISRGSGQESLPAVRSPVLTGAGSCGGFLILEDSIPVRPSGFCNVNQLFETVSEQARQVEVIRGPGNALYGSNALHGTINILMPETSNGNGAVEFGANDFARLRGTLSGSAGLLTLVYADDGGFRDAAGYRQGKLHAGHSWDFADSSLRLAFSATDLDQETAGFIVGEDSYRNPAINRSNPNPEAFRRANSQRLYGVWTRQNVEVRPYLRRSDMRFLQHFLPGQPLEENGHVSAGVILSTTSERDESSWQYGIDIEWADVFLKQSQTGATEGSAFLMETRPAGKHYDYDVTSLALSPWAQAEFRLGKRLTASLGLRAEYVNYDYTNNMLTGNTRDDGSVCGFGGCLYTRPADRDDNFTNFAPKLGLRFMIAARSSLFVTATRGFRAPQMTELYRLQSGQTVADLDSERLDALEAGWRLRRDEMKFELAAFQMRKRGSVLRDANGFNVSGARSRHDGIEAALGWQP